MGGKTTKRNGVPGEGAKRPSGGEGVGSGVARIFSVGGHWGPCVFVGGH